MVFFSIGIDKEMEAMLVELLAQRLVRIFCAGKQLPLHIRKTLSKRRAAQTLQTWNTDLTMQYWECLSPGGSHRGSDGKWDFHIATASVSCEWIIRELVYWGLEHWPDLATSKPRGTDPTHTQLAWRPWKQTARPIHNWLAEHHGITQVVMIIIKYIHTTAFEKKPQLFLCTHIA